MRPDVHAAALRSAAKLVLGMASFAVVTTGCSSEASDDTGVSNDAVMTKNNDVSIIDNDLGKGTDEETTKACKATLASAFPDTTTLHYGNITAQPAEVMDCCQQELVKHGSMTAYRWECCFAYDDSTKVDPGKDGELNEWEVPILANQAPGFACTPWGPPVPPPMNRGAKRNKKTSPARRDMNRFIARQVEAQMMMQVA